MRAYFIGENMPVLPQELRYVPDPPYKPRLQPQFQKRDGVHIEIEQECSYGFKEVVDMITDECGIVPDIDEISISVGYVECDGDDCYMTHMSFEFDCIYYVQRYTDEEYKEVRKKHMKDISKWKERMREWEKKHQKKWHRRCQLVKQGFRRI